MSQFLITHPLDEFPQVYQNIREIKIICDVSHKKNCRLYEDIHKFKDDMYFATAGELAVDRYEQIAKISADPENESLSFRRERLKNRYNMTPPFTRRFYSEKLNEIIGVGKWKGYLNADRNILTVETSAFNQNWYYEIFETFNILKAIHVLFILKPTVVDQYIVNETISYNTAIWNYRLGKWRLGRQPFFTIKDGAQLTEGGIEGMAIESGMSQVLSQAVVNATEKVIINDTHIINTFEMKQIRGDNAVIEYRLNSSLTDIVKNIKTAQSDGTILTDNTVYMPMIEDVNMKHEYTFRGVNKT